MEPKGRHAVDGELTETDRGRIRHVAYHLQTWDAWFRQAFHQEDRHHSVESITPEIAWETEERHLPRDDQQGPRQDRNGGAPGQGRQREEPIPEARQRQLTAPFLKNILLNASCSLSFKICKISFKISKKLFFGALCDCFFKILFIFAE